MIFFVFFFNSFYFFVAGQKFAQNELKTVLAYLLKNYKIESVQSYDELNIGFDMVLTPENGIMIKIKNR